MGEAALQLRIHKFKYALKTEREGYGHESIGGNLFGTLFGTSIAILACYDDGTTVMDFHRQSDTSAVLVFETGLYDIPTS